MGFPLLLLALFGFFTLFRKAVLLIYRACHEYASSSGTSGREGNFRAAD